jgi:hypothetical protein
MVTSSKEAASEMVHKIVYEECAGFDAETCQVVFVDSRALSMSGLQSEMSCLQA